MMQWERKYCFCLAVTILCGLLLPAQDSTAIKITDTNLTPSSNSLVTVGEILITGNKKTKRNIILREIPFTSGEQYTLEALVKKFEDARRQLMNTALFHSVMVAAKGFEKNIVIVSVELKERWYLFPVPYLKPVDRNLNQWLVEQKASLNRVNFGARLTYYNATGRNDKLKATIGIGYTKNFSVSYDRLYIDQKLKWGMSFGFSTGKNKEVNYNTIKDKQVFVKDNDNFLSKYTNAYFQLTYRRKIKTRHSFGIAYNVGEVGDTIIALNSSYYNYKSGRKFISYPELFYNMTYYNVDYIPYPTKGYAARVDLEKKGFDNRVNLWHISVRGSGYWHFTPKIFFGLNIYGAIKAPFNQPYISRYFLGYGETFLQGYEYYVIDGVAGGYLKTTLSHELVNFSIRVPPKKKGKEATRIPFRIFSKVYGNAGYVHNPQPGDNLLSNKMLYSGGFGIDIVSLYDITFKLEYTFNQLGQNGLFLHRKSIF